MSQTLVQSIVGTSAAAATVVQATFSAGATKGNLIISVVGMDKSSGVMTPPTGFATLVKQDSASVSTWVGVKVADGGETAISFTRATASTAGDTMWIEEWSDTNTLDPWTILGLASDLTNETTRAVTPSGTTLATVAQGRACAYFTIDSGQSNTGTLTYTNGYTNIRTYAASGRGDVAAANLADVAVGTLATTSQTHTPTADQTSGVIVVFAKIALANQQQTQQYGRNRRARRRQQQQWFSPDTSVASTPITLSDTGTGTDALSVAAAVPLADTAAGTDTLAVNAAVPLSDTGAGTDALSVAAAVPLADTLSGTDALSITVSIPLAETGTLTDALTVVGPVLLVNSTEQITPSGTTVTTGNSGGGGDAAWDATSIGTGATDASDSAHAAHGNLSNQLATGGTAGTTYNKWTTQAGSIPQVWFREYLYFTANPAASHRVWSCFQGATLVAAVRLGTSGVFTFLDAAGAAITNMTLTTAIPLNQWFRIEGYVIGDASVGQVELKLFTSMDSLTATETKASTATQALTGVPNDYRFGMSSSLANVGPYWQDDVALSSTGYVGPAGTQVTLTDTGTGTDALTIAATDTLTEAVSGADSLSVAASVPLADTGSGTDALALSAAVPLGETGHGADALTANASAPQADTATGTEGLSITVQVVLSDTGTLTDVLVVGAGNTPSLPDTATGTEGFAVSAAVPLADTGHGTDGFTVNVAAPLTDTGSLTEGFSIVKSGAGFLVVGIAKAVTLWDDGAAAVTLWQDGPAVEDTDDATAVSLWLEGPAVTAWDAGEAIEAI